MRTILLLIAVFIITITGCVNTPHGNGNSADFARARESGNFSDNGAIALHEGGYRFTIILVKDPEWALKSLEIADYGLPHVSRYKRGEKVSPFLTFMTFNSGKMDLSYSVRLEGPGGKFREFHNLRISGSTVSESRGYPADEFAAIDLDETYAPGIYQFHIIIREKGNIKNACIMQFELREK